MDFGCGSDGRESERSISSTCRSVGLLMQLEGRKRDSRGRHAKRQGGAAHRFEDAATTSLSRIARGSGDALASVGKGTAVHLTVSPHLETNDL